METGNSGLIGYTETRTNINAMKEYYQKEYKKIVDKEKKADSNLFRNKWRVRFGSFTTCIGLTFSSNSHKGLAKLGVHAVSRIIQKIMYLKNKVDKKKYKKQRDQLTADFINAEGEFKQFDVVNSTTIEPVNEHEEEKGFQR